MENDRTRRTETPRMRVVFVDHLALLSGGERVLLTLLPALARRVDVQVVLGEDGPLVGRLRSRGIGVEILALPTRVRNARKERVRLASLDTAALGASLGYVQKLRRYLRTLDPDIVHTNSLKAALYGGTAARLARVPVVWHVRDHISADYLPDTAVHTVRGFARILPTAVVANSRSTLATLPASVNGRVIYNPVMPPGAPVSTRPTEAQGFTVGMVGRLAPWKGQNVFLNAFAAAFRDSDARARIIGSAMFGEDAYAESLRRLAKSLGIEAQVEWRGFRDDVWAELEELDALVHCSVTPEPFGQVILEGMAAGVPVIAAGAGGPVEIITPGINGLLTAPGDAAALAEALIRLKDDPALREQLSENGRVRAQDFTADRSADELVRLYESIRYSR